MLFTDEACFTKEGIFNTHNSHVWALNNPHATYIRGHQQRFAVNIWTGIVDNFLIGPYMLPQRLNAINYCVFLRDVLPELLENVPLVIRENMWFQHDGAPAHFSNRARNHLNRSFGARWIGRGGPVAWPPRSPDLTPCDFFLWGTMKELVYDTPVDNEQTLIQRIMAAAEVIQTNHDNFYRSRQSLLPQCVTCHNVKCSVFEHSLRYLVH